MIVFHDVDIHLCDTELHKTQNNYKMIQPNKFYFG